MSIGFWQLVLIFLIILVLFGAGRISKVMGELGKGVKSFKEGLGEASPPSASLSKDTSPKKKLPSKKTSPEKETSKKRPATKKQ